MKASTADLIYATLASHNPSPTTELVYHSPFQLLAAVLLSAQATDVGVNRATKTLFKVAPDALSMLALGEQGVKNHIKTIGLYNTKAHNLIAACRILVEEYSGEVPSHRSALESLPGVGRKTANVVLNTAFGLPTIAVDTHIFRVSNRTGLAKGKNAVQVEQGLMKITAAKYLKNAHHWLILHGRYTCVARKPKCYNCVIEKLCEYEKKDISAS